MCFIFILRSPLCKIVHPPLIINEMLRDTSGRSLWKKNRSGAAKGGGGSWSRGTLCCVREWSMDVLHAVLMFVEPCIAPCVGTDCISSIRPTTVLPSHVQRPLLRLRRSAWMLDVHADRVSPASAKAARLLLPRIGLDVDRSCSGISLATRVDVDKISAKLLPRISPDVDKSCRTASAKIEARPA
jgi:hypothetical protein